MQTVDSQPIGIRRVLAAFGIFAGAAVHSVLPHAAFGTYDMFVRAAITGVVSGAVAMVILFLVRPRPENSTR